MRGAVIAGATGMLGRALTENLVDHETRVLLLVNPSSQRLDGLLQHPLVTIYPCSLDALHSLNEANKGQWDTFFHLAWGGTFGMSRNGITAQEANIRFSLDAVEAARRLGCHCFVGAGSQAEYGRVEGVLHPDTPTNPENGYGIAKLAAGQMTRLLCRQFGMRHVWARILSVYGPNDGTATMVSSALRSFLEGERPCFTPGEQLWDYLYRDDAAEALQLLGERGRDGAIYPVGSGVARPLKEYVEILRDAVDSRLEVGLGEVAYGPKQVMHLCADISFLQRDVGFEPRVSFEEGVRRTLEWMRASTEA